MTTDGGTEGGITLNLNADPQPKKKSKKRPDYDAHEADNAFAENTANKPFKKKRRLNNEDGEEGDGENGEDHGHGKKEQLENVISSLFKHNPDIPHLESGEVNPVSEAVFSGSGFDANELHPYLVKNLGDFGIEKMTTVQSLAIPVVLAGKDALIKSQTGSGKTLAYALPILHKLQALEPKISRADGCHALVVVPTRELAMQSFEWFEKLCRSFARIVPGILLGGEKKKSEKARVRKGINILVSTPGRLIDHIEHTKSLSLKNLQFLVLDEADRMLELGYERDVQKIITAINENTERERQTLLLSATLTSGIEQLSEVSMKHPKFVDAATAEDENEVGDMTALTTPENLKQTYLIAPAKLRLVTLASFILWKTRYSKKRKMLVFMSTQVRSFILKMLQRPNECLEKMCP